MRRSKLRVVYDACVLYPNLARDVLITLATLGLFEARWTEDIHREWTRSLLKDKPHLEVQIQRIRELVDQAVPDCLVEGYQQIIGSLTLPDENDRHVLAAAIQAGATEIVTFNLTDFPKKLLRPHSVLAVHPDAFVVGLLETFPRFIAEALDNRRQTYRKPLMSRIQYCERLHQVGFMRTSGKLLSILEPGQP